MGRKFVISNSENAITKRKKMTASRNRKIQQQKNLPVTRHIDFDTKKHQKPVNEKQLKQLEEKILKYEKEENRVRKTEGKKIAHAIKSRSLKKLKILKNLKLKQEGTFVPQEFMTLEKMRIADLSAEAHKIDDQELIHAETNDEMLQYFTLNQDPKVAITTTSQYYDICVELAKDLEAIFGQTIKYFPRPSTQPDIREMCVELMSLGFSSLIVVHANQTIKKPSHLMVIALPYGPTAYFRLTSLFLRKELRGCVEPLKLNPEVILTNFTTRLGRRVARILQQTLSQKEVLKGRQVVTFHNQRDFIFFRAYRYQFKESTRTQNEEDKQSLMDKINVGMDEIGPQFTLRLRWLQVGVYNPQYEEFEFVQPPHEESINKKLMFL